MEIDKNMQYYQHTSRKQLSGSELNINVTFCSLDKAICHFGTGIILIVLKIDIECFQFCNNYIGDTM